MTAEHEGRERERGEPQGSGIRHRRELHERRPAAFLSKNGHYNPPFEENYWDLSIPDRSLVKLKG